ncbi:MAG TPA: hypothetical protein VJQ08_08115 [Candidatus Dormibacteraeota bacterium]|nr:hypothetical protein [Candidatus Dormibacteraeota bacterium]
MKVRLDFGAWQARADEQPSQAGLHRRLRRLSECAERTVHAPQALAKRRVEHDESIDSRKPHAEVRQRSSRGRCVEGPDDHDLICGDN